MHVLPLPLQFSGCLARKITSTELSLRRVASGYLLPEATYSTCVECDGYDTETTPSCGFSSRIWDRCGFEKDFEAHTHSGTMTIREICYRNASLLQTIMETLTLPLIIALAFAVGLWTFASLWTIGRRPSTLPPGPPTLPIIVLNP